MADPNFAPMYATRSRRVKTDRRDARTLMEALRLGAYRAIHRASATQRHVRAQLAVREALIRTRTRYVNVVRALTRRDGLRLPLGRAGTPRGEARGAAGARAAGCRIGAAPRSCWGRSTTPITAADARLAAVVAGDPVVTQLCTAPGIGPVTAVAFVATLDVVTRFTSAHQVEAYLGLTPREYSSGERQQRGRISKTGNTRMRALLVEAAWRLLRQQGSRGRAAARPGPTGIAARRGRRSRPSPWRGGWPGILYAMWRDGTDYRARGGAAVAVA